MGGPARRPATGARRGGSWHRGGGRGGRHALPQVRHQRTAPLWLPQRSGDGLHVGPRALHVLRSGPNTRDGEPARHPLAEWRPAPGTTPMRGPSAAGEAGGRARLRVQLHDCRLEAEMLGQRGLGVARAQQAP